MSKSWIGGVNGVLLHDQEDEFPSMLEETTVHSRLCTGLSSNALGSEASREPPSHVLMFSSTEIFVYIPPRQARQIP